MRTAVMILMNTLAAGCALFEERLDPAVVGLNASYDANRCDVSRQSPPCILSFGAYWTQQLDSGLITFRRDGKFDVMLSTRTEDCRCALSSSGCPSGCTRTDDLWRQSGTYEVFGDTVVVSYRSSDYRERGDTYGLPARVTSNWPGPDSLSYRAIHWRRR